jgi:hypothetical protein
MRALVISYSQRVFQKFFELLGKAFIVFVGLWIVFALTFEGYMVYLQVTGQVEKTMAISNWFSWTFDGTFKNSPGNIWYEEPKKIDISSVSNKVVVGSLAGNRNLEFGLKNILEEVVQEKDYELDKTSNLKITAEIVYLDVLKTQSSFSVLHNNKESVVIRLKGYLYKDGKLEKKVTVEESADEVSMSALLVDEGGKFNQQNLSSALKKASVSLVNKLL